MPTQARVDTGRPDTAAADALADQLHVLNCTPLIGDATFTPQHRDYDLARARHLLAGLADTGWTLTRTKR